jgi:hypothetical protein
LSLRIGLERTAGIIEISPPMAPETEGGFERLAGPLQCSLVYLVVGNRQNSTFEIDNEKSSVLTENPVHWMPSPIIHVGIATGSGTTARSLNSIQE